jgi:hypothetical protein
MKFIKLNIRFLIPALLLCFLLQLKGFCQGTDPGTNSQQHFYFGLSIDPSQSVIFHNSVSTITKLNTSSKNSIGGCVEVGYLFSKYFGFAAGLGYSTYLTNLSLDTYADSVNTIDSEQEAYKRRISGNDIKETQKISCLNIPLLANIQLPVNEKFGFYLQAGINLSIPISKKYSSSGTFTYKGFYPAYNVLLEDLPDYGFSNYTRVSSEGELLLKSTYTDVMVCTGLKFSFRKNIKIGIGAFYIKSLSDISIYSARNKFLLSMDKNQINSFMGGSSKTTVQLAGLKISLHLFL